MAQNLYDFDQTNFEASVQMDSEFSKTVDEVNKIRHSIHLSEHLAKSVKSLLAHSDSLCENRKLQDLQFILGRHISVSNHNLPAYVKSIIELQFLFGLRISEALQIDHSQVMFNGAINIRGLKGSNDRFVYPVKYRDFWLQVKRSNSSPGQYYNRFYFYRLYKKIGISGLLSFNKNHSVTHYMRYMYVLQLLKETDNVESIKNLLGHKSIKSTMHYIEKLNGKERIN